MRASQFLLPTLRDVPADAEIASHRLMLRAGMIRPLASGLYTWLPLGLRVLRKIERVVREEMDAAGALETLMPAVQPAELWRRSGRWDAYGPELLRITDRHQRDFVFGPTHEEVVTDLARRLLSSHRQLPVNLYQIQTKFRDEIRPRFGVMRAREFIMKDAYSFHADEASLDATYRAMHAAYTRIFTRLGLEFRAVRADTGAIGGSESHEFQILADTGEDAIAFSADGGYAANVELAPAPAPPARAAASEELRVIDTPGVGTIAELGERLGAPPERCLKALFVAAADGGVAALFLRGDHELNATKAAAHPLVAAPLRFADADEIVAATGCPPGSLGPVGLDKVPVVADHWAAALHDFFCGANQEGRHCAGANWGRDAPEPQTADLRNICAGEPAPDGGAVRIRRGIEAGHIFKLGVKYSEALDARALDEGNTRRPMIMGCYGIGVSRIAAAAIEQNHDDAGIVWPAPLAPFEAIIAPVRFADDARVREIAEALHAELEAAGVETLLDDRPLRPGEMFADAELIGAPWRLVVGPKGLKQNAVECVARRGGEASWLPTADCAAEIAAKCRAARA